MRYDLPDEAATMRLGGELAAWLRDCFQHDACVYLRGDLGAGKTTLTRGILRAFGFQGAVKSPTYTLLEPYELAACTVLHLDLYRLARADELVFVGLDEALDTPGIKLIEWPERGEGFLPPADIDVWLELAGAGAGAGAGKGAGAGAGKEKGIETGRVANIDVRGPRG